MLLEGLIMRSRTDTKSAHYCLCRLSKKNPDYWAGFKDEQTKNE